MNCIVITKPQYRWSPSFLLCSRQKLKFVLKQLCYKYNLLSRAKYYSWTNESVMNCYISNYTFNCRLMLFTTGDSFAKSQRIDIKYTVVGYSSELGEGMFRSKEIPITQQTLIYKNSDSIVYCFCVKPPPLYSYQMHRCNDFFHVVQNLPNRFCCSETPADRVGCCRSNILGRNRAFLCCCL